MENNIFIKRMIQESEEKGYSKELIIEKLHITLEFLGVKVDICKDDATSLSELIKDKRIKINENATKLEKLENYSRALVMLSLWIKETKK